MDFFNQAINQVRDLLLSMTPAARVTAVLLLGVIVVSMGYLVQHHSAGPDEYLFNGEFLPGRDIDRAEAAIAQARLEGYQRDGNRIKVPSGRKSEFLAAVADAGALPPNYHSVIESALDLGPFTDRTTRKERLKAAREQQLSMIVRAMDGIEEAQVIYDVLEPEGLSRKVRATASVSVRPVPGEVLEGRQAKLIKKAVASAIAGLSTDNVTVTNLGDGTSFSSDEITGESFEDDYYQHRVTYEKLMQSKIENLLRNYPGTHVEVTAELDDTLERTARTVKPEGDPAVIRETQEDESSETSEIANGGRPGTFAQGPSRGGTEEAPEVTVKNKDTTTITQTENINGQRDEFLRTAALVPKYVRVAIAVPEILVVNIWRERQRNEGNDPGESYPDGTQMQGMKTAIKNTIDELVAPMLPREIAENPFSSVSVQFIESLPEAELLPPTFADQALAWAHGNFNTMMMAVVAFFSLFMLRSIIKSIPASSPSAPFGAQSLALDFPEGEYDADPTEESELDAEGRPKLRLKKGTNLKDDLTDIVQEDPDAAAAILRSWISNAG